MHKTLLTTLGLALTGLAILGIFLPVIPTTPLLLLALACFAKSSEKLHSWLLTHRTFGPLISQWHETRSMPRKAKVYAIISIAIAGGGINYFCEYLSFETPSDRGTPHSGRDYSQNQNH
jgi:uncharacterized membrane protein YbaN (DUF454 family)